MVDVSFAPVLAALEPIVVQVSVVVIAAGVSWAAAQFARATHINIQGAALDKLTKAAQAEAGAAIAAAENNLAGAKIEIGNPIVAAAASRIVNAMPEVLVAAGVTPTNVATMIAGELGRLQASMTAAPPITKPMSS